MSSNRIFGMGIVFIALGFIFAGFGIWSLIEGNTIGIVSLMSGLFIVAMGFINIGTSRRAE